MGVTSICRQIILSLKIPNIWVDWDILSKWGWVLLSLGKVYMNKTSFSSKVFYNYSAEILADSRQRRLFMRNYRALLLILNSLKCMNRQLNTFLGGNIHFFSKNLFVAVKTENKGGEEETDIVNSLKENRSYSKIKPFSPYFWTQFLSYD